MEQASAADENMSKFELVERVFGQQSHGRVIALASGTTPTTYRSDRRLGSSSSSSSRQQQAETQRLTEENIRLNNRVTQMQFDMDNRMMQMRAEMEANMRAEIMELLARRDDLPPHPPPPS